MKCLTGPCNSRTVGPNVVQHSETSRYGPGAALLSSAATGFLSFAICGAAKDGATLTYKYVLAYPSVFRPNMRESQ